MADLLHANGIQQLEVALVGSPAAQVIDLLSEGLVQSSVATTSAFVQPHPRSYTSTPPVPPPTSLPVEGISSPSPVVVPVMATSDAASHINVLLLFWGVHHHQLALHHHQHPPVLLCSLL